MTTAPPLTISLPLPPPLQRLSSLDPPTLSTLKSPDLETLKTQVDTLKQTILSVQNSRSPLLRLPPELRNQIFHAAMRSELEHRNSLPQLPWSSDGRRNSDNGNERNFFADPPFFRTCRSIREECVGVWFADVAVWEEWDSGKNCWRRLEEMDVRELQRLRAGIGACSIVTRRAFCGERKMRGAVEEESGNVCRRKGVVSFEGEKGECGMRWWVW